MIFLEEFLSVFCFLGRKDLKYYEIMILQDEDHLNEDLWKPRVPRNKMPHVEGMLGVKRRYHLPPKNDDPDKDYLRYTNGRQMLDRQTD